MRNFWHRFALEGIWLALTAGFVVGCAPNDGSKDREEGIAAYETGDIGRAERLLERSVKVSPANADAWVVLVQVKLKLGDMLAAKAAVQKAKELAGEDIDIRLLDAQVAWYVKDYEVAIERFRAIATDSQLSAEYRARGWAGVGIVEFTNNDFHRARLSFLKALKLDRKNAPAWYHLALVYRDGLGYSEAALDQFEVFVHLEADATPRVQKVLKSMIPEIKESIQRTAVNRAGVATRNSAVCAAEIAKAEAEAKKGGVKNLKNALEHYQAALKADALSYPAALGLAVTWQKVDKTKKGLEKSYEAYKTACTLKASAISTYLKTGKLAYDLGRYAEATEVYSRALAANPMSCEAADGVIKSMRKTGNRELAEEYQAYRNIITKK